MSIFKWRRRSPTGLNTKWILRCILVAYRKVARQAQRTSFCGDINTAHESIDLARPKENEDSTGFLPEERAWIDEVVYHGYADVFRHLYPR